MDAYDGKFDENNHHWKVYMEKQKAIADVLAKIADSDALAIK